jgi:hypothetical protein
VTAAELLAELVGLGFRLAVRGNDIGVAPAGRLTDAQRQVIREHKAELLALLRAGEPAAAEGPELPPTAAPGPTSARAESASPEAETQPAEEKRPLCNQCRQPYPPYTPGCAACDIRKVEYWPTKVIRGKDGMFHRVHASFVPPPGFEVVPEPT